MNPDLEHLIVLQAQDLELRRLRAALEEAPREVMRAEQALQRAQEALRAVRAELTAEERLRREQESELQAQGEKVRRLQRALDTATSEVQVAALQREIDFAQTAIRGVEDEELASMERTEGLEQGRARAEAEATAATRQLEETRSRMEQQSTAHREQIQGIERQRSELRAGIDAQRLAAYDRLAKAKGIAVAEALGDATQGRCAACQMVVRPQRWQQLTGRDHPDEIFSCETCGRMLFWDPRRDTPRAWEAGDRLARAQSGGGR